MASATYTLELTRDWTCLEAHGRDLAGLPRHITSLAAFWEELILQQMRAEAHRFA